MSNKTTNIIRAKETEDNDSTKHLAISLVKFIIRELIICGLVVCAIFYFVRPTVVSQMSMYPTCKPGDYYLLNRQVYRSAEPERGDIIVFKSKMDNGNGFGKKMLIKRIIALPGDHIEIKDGKVYLNGKQADEEYLPEGTTTSGEADITLPENSYYVMGDNREVSIDSRSPKVGLVDKSTIYGKAFVRLFPFTSAGKVN